MTVDGAALRDVQAGNKKANGIFVEIYPLWKNNNVDYWWRLKFLFLIVLLNR